MHYTDDKGANWSVGAGYVLDAAIDISSSEGAGNAGYEARRIAVAYSQGDLSMAIHVIANDTSLTYRDRMIQLYSTDLGASFENVESTGNSESFANPEILVVDGVFMLFYVGGSSAAANIKVWRRRAATAATKFTSDTAVATTAQVADWTTNEITPYPSSSAIQAEDGTLYVVALRTSNSSEYYGIISRSVDGGTNWTELGNSPISAVSMSTWYEQGQQTVTTPRDFRGAFHQGRICLLHNWNANPGNEDNSLAALYLGGYSTVTMPGFKLFPEDTQRVGFEQTYLPYDLPTGGAGTRYWTKSSTGSPTEALANGALAVTTSGSEYLYYSRQGTPDNAYSTTNGTIVSFSVTVDSGGATTLNRIAVSSRQSNGSSNGSNISIRFSTSAFRVWDEIASSAIGSDVTIDTTAGVDVLFSHFGPNFALWYRARSLSSDRNWIAGPASTTASDDSGGGGAGFLRWGHLVLGASDSNWHMFLDMSSDSTYIGQGLWSGQSNPAELFPRPISTEALGVDDGVKIAGVDGPGMYGDIWNIDTRYRYSWSRALPTVSASPRIKWRSTADNAVERFAFLFDGHGGTGTAETLSDTICLYLSGCNWRLGELQGWNGSAWATIVSIDLASNLTALPYVRKGDVVTVNTSASHTGNRWILPGEYIGGTIDLGSSKFRKIKWHDDGVWSTEITKRPQFVLEDIDNTEPSSGTLNLWSPKLTVLKALAGVKYGGYRLEISAQHTADDFYEIGTLLIGPVIPFGYQYSWDRSVQREANVNLTTFEDGQRVAESLGPPRRSYILSWTDPVDMTNIQGINPSPDYILGTATAGAVPFGARVSTPWTLEGLVQLTNGSERPVVYLPVIPKSDLSQMTEAPSSCYSRIVSAYRSDGVLGDEMTNEVVRVSSVTLEEEL
jgi:hypothetical protein